MITSEQSVKSNTLSYYTKIKNKHSCDILNEIKRANSFHLILKDKSYIFIQEDKKHTKVLYVSDKEIGQDKKIFSFFQTRSKKESLKGEKKLTLFFKSLSSKFDLLDSYKEESLFLFVFDLFHVYSKTENNGNTYFSVVVYNNDKTFLNKLKKIFKNARVD